jgi:hypothetical protein
MMTLLSSLQTLVAGGPDRDGVGESSPLLLASDDANRAPPDTDGYEGYVGARAHGASHKAHMKAKAVSVAPAAAPGEGARPSVLKIFWRSIWALKSLSASPNDLESRDYDMYESDVMMRHLHERRVRARAVCWLRVGFRFCV